MFLKNSATKILLFVLFSFLFIFSQVSALTIIDDFEDYGSNLCASNWVDYYSSSTFICGYAYVGTYQSSKRASFYYMSNASSNPIYHSDVPSFASLDSISITYMSNYNWNSTFWGNSPVRYFLYGDDYNESLFVSMRCNSSSLIDCTYNLNQTGTQSCGSLIASNCNANTTYIVSLNKIDDSHYQLSVNGNDSSEIYIDFVPTSWSFLPKTYSKSSYVDYYDNFLIEYSPTVVVVDGECGTDNGQIIETYPENFCGAGELIPLSYLQTFTGWQWACSGLNGGLTAWCGATWGELGENAVCGADDGEILTEDPVNLCLVGQYMPDSMIQTVTGWQWLCMGVGSGEHARCSSIMDYSIIIGFPQLPQSEDCSSYSVPDSWFCEMNNIAKSIILPSHDKLNDLNMAINQIQAKAPFNYIAKATEKLSELQDIEQGDITMTLWGNTGTISLSPFSDFFSQIKIAIGFLFSLGFLFWGINYIKRVFI